MMSEASDDGTVETRKVTTGYRIDPEYRPDPLVKYDKGSDGVTEDNREEVLKQLPIFDNPNRTIESKEQPQGRQSDE